MRTAILDDADRKYPYIKRFTFEPTAKPQRYLGDNEKSSLLLLSDEHGLHVEVVFGGADSFRPAMEIVARDFIAVKSVKAKGKRLTTFAIDHITELEPIATEDILDEDDAEPGQSSESADQESEDVAEPEKSDDEVRDELTGQHRLF